MCARACVLCVCGICVYLLRVYWCSTAAPIDIAPFACRVRVVCVCCLCVCVCSFVLCVLTFDLFSPSASVPSTLRYSPTAPTGIVPVVCARACMLSVCLCAFVLCVLTCDFLHASASSSSHRYSPTAPTGIVPVTCRVCACVRLVCGCVCICSVSVDLRPSFAICFSLVLAFTRYCFTSKLCCGSQSSFYCPSTCKAYPIAIRFHDHCATYAPPTTPPPFFYAMHHTILVMAVSCNGQASSLQYSPYLPR